MYRVFASVSGVLVGLLFVLLAGALTVRVIGAESGAVFDLNNRVVAVTAPQTPVLPLVALALLGGAFIVVMATIPASRSMRVWFVAGNLVALLFLCAWAFVADVPQFQGGSEPPGITEGWLGWIEKGGLSTAVHVAAVMAAAILWRDVFGARDEHSQAAESRSPSSDETTPDVI